MKKLFLLVAMAFITSVASAQISMEKFNQLNVNVSKQSMEATLSSYGFAYDSNGVLKGVIDNKAVAVTFRTLENGMIEKMMVTEQAELTREELNQRVMELKAVMLDSNDKFTLKKEEASEGRYRVILVY